MNAKLKTIGLSGICEVRVKRYFSFLFSLCGDYGTGHKVVKIPSSKAFIMIKLLKDISQTSQVRFTLQYESE